MKKAILWLLLGAWLGGIGLAGCGQTGPLYLPPAKPSQPQPTATSVKPIAEPTKPIAQPTPSIAAPTSAQASSAKTNP